MTTIPSGPVIVDLIAFKQPHKRCCSDVATSRIFFLSIYGCCPFPCLWLKVSDFSVLTTTRPQLPKKV